MAESFVYKQYKGKDIELPLTDEMRKYLEGRSKDTLIAECDEVWANLNNHPADEESNEESEIEEVESYSDLNKTELKAEIDERNGKREEDDKIHVGGGATKQDLIDALEEDDRTHPDEEEDEEPNDE